MVVNVAQYLTSMFKGYDGINWSSNIQREYLQEKQKVP
jgi:hypothetical protein